MQVGSDFSCLKFIQESNGASFESVEQYSPSYSKITCNNIQLQDEEIRCTELKNEGEGILLLIQRIVTM